MNRKDNIHMLGETLQILRQGYYEKNDQKINLKLSYDEMKTAQVYLPEDVSEISKGLSYPNSCSACAFTCENIDSFSMARKRENALVLNFANPVHPGGGVRHGAKAQEEDLCRKSSLLLSLESDDAQQYYDYHRYLRSYMATDALIISPKVEIIRDGDGNLLDDSVIVSVVTCAAPMISQGIEFLRHEEYMDLFEKRISGLVMLAGALGYRNLVLGAWGCGAFGNDPHIVSGLFYKTLKEINCNALFDHIDFAVLDHSEDQTNFKQFRKYFSYF